MYVYVVYVYLQVWAAATEIELSNKWAIVVLIVKTVLVAAVRFVLTEIQSEENFTADMKFTLDRVVAI